jgi:hypothetical protein
LCSKLNAAGKVFYSCQRKEGLRQACTSHVRGKRHTLLGYPCPNRQPFWASSDERVDYEAAPLVRLTLNSPPLTLCSPALRVSAGKSGVGGVSGR